MPRPRHWRHVDRIPTAVYFKPAGIPLRALTQTTLAVEELEALRLRDVEGLEQEECATRMGISRPTFHRVLKAARQKVADALVNGKAVAIEGGDFVLSGERLRCLPAGHEWNVAMRPADGEAVACPHCQSQRFSPVGRQQQGHGGHGRRHHGGPLT